MTINSSTKPWHKPWLLMASVAAFILSALVFVSFITQNIASKEESAKASNYEPDQIVVRVNKERVDKGLPPLVVNEKLQLAAQNKVSDMAKNNYFSHISPVDGTKWSDFIKQTEYKYLEAGENLANGYNNVEEMVQAWMNSPTHRENILSTGYFETGVAYERGVLNGRTTIFVAQVFGRQTTQPTETIKLYREKEEGTLEKQEHQDGSLMSLWDQD